MSVVLEACSRLDALLSATGFQHVDLLRLSVLGREFSALRSAEPWLRSVRALAISVLRDSVRVKEMAEMLMSAFES